jgi:two-component system sensor kinase FixL
MFGYQAAEVIGKNVKCLMPSPYQEEHDAYLDRYRRTGEKRVIGIGRHVVARKKNGEVFPIDLAVGEVGLCEGRIFAGFIRDVSDRKEAEQKLHELRNDLLHVSRLSEMGEMASALAHELNQPLTAIINYLEACGRMLERPDAADQERAKGLMRKASDQAARAGQIIQQLRKFVAKGETDHTREQVNPVVREAAELALIGTRQHEVVTRFDLAAGLPEVMIDRVQLQQVIMNLVRNAVDALSEMERRELTIRTGADGQDAVRIDVIDRGPGLPDDIAKRLFQPFVTSKPGGIGIGLSICKTIVDAHDGELWTTENPEGGAIFHIRLPVRED